MPVRQLRSRRLQRRADALPFQPEDRIAVGVALRNGRAAELRPQRSSWHCAQERSSCPMRRCEQRAAFLAERLEARVGIGGDCHPAGLQAEIGRHCQQGRALPCPALATLPLRAALLDAAREIDWRPLAVSKAGIAGRDALHAPGRIAMAAAQACLPWAGAADQSASPSAPPAWRGWRDRPAALPACPRSSARSRSDAGPAGWDRLGRKPGARPEEARQTSH